MTKPYIRVSAGNWQIRFDFPFRLSLLPHERRRFALAASTLVLANQNASQPVQMLEPEVAGHEAPAAHESLPDVFLWGIIDWNFRFQRPQHLALGLGERGHRVFYISSDILSAAEPGFTVQPVDDRVSVIRLHARQPASIYGAAPSATLLADLTASLGKVVAWAGCPATVSLVEHPFWHKLAMALPNNRLVADVLDHLSGFDNSANDMQAREEAMLRDADLAVVTSGALEEFARPRTRNVVTVRNATDYDHFSEQPDFLFADKQKRRIIGYYGAIASWFDATIVARLAEAFPDCLILMIGADSAGVEKTLKRYSNIRFTGEVPYAQLPAYLHAFDVAIMPFKANELTRATNPVKVYEYLSAGKPVVATELPEMAQFGELARTAATPEEFVDAVGEALQENQNKELVKKRRAFASTQTWKHRVDALARALDAIPRPRVSLVIVAYNQLHLTRLCLDSIDERSRYEALEVIAVDNASSDGTADYLRQWEMNGSGRRAVISPDNLGFAGGVNAGLKAATGDILVVMNNDLIVTDGWIGTLAAHLRDPKLGLVGPVTNNIGNEAKINLPYTGFDAMPPAALAYTAAHLGKRFPIETLAFFCVAMRRDVFEKIGLLDERFGQGYFEDDDYCRRVSEAGYDIGCAEDVFIHHEHSATFDTIGEQRRQELFRRNLKLYEEKWGTWKAHKYRESDETNAAGN